MDTEDLEKDLGEAWLEKPDRQPFANKIASFICFWKKCLNPGKKND
ncbi:hypothetical protein OGH69_01425 [Flavobacterium sp. MFBS3-15]|nr:hypothetical protein [Flavobacterium sp. MFBS3-15]MCW4467616.1 hypothetical protein [Flavobacterium sp. MFBS3-15]